MSIRANVTSSIGAQKVHWCSRLCYCIFFFSHFYDNHRPHLHFFIFCFVLSFNSCKRFANQNAMYSRYGLYFRFTALQTVCKYYQLNEGKQKRSHLFTSIFKLLRLQHLSVLSCCRFCCKSDGATCGRSVQLVHEATFKLAGHHFNLVVAKYFDWRSTQWDLKCRDML